MRAFRRRRTPRRREHRRRRSSNETLTRKGPGPSSAWLPGYLVAFADCTHLHLSGQACSQDISRLLKRISALLTADRRYPTSQRTTDRSESQNNATVVCVGRFAGDEFCLFEVIRIRLLYLVGRHPSRFRSLSRSDLLQFQNNPMTGCRAVERSDGCEVGEPALPFASLSFSGADDAQRTLAESSSLRN